MTTAEQDILEQIAEVELEQKEARSLVAFYKKAAVDAETQLIAANLKYESLKEKLRVYRNQHPQKEITPRERDIEELRQKLPELMKKI